MRPYKDRTVGKGKKVLKKQDKEPLWETKVPKSKDDKKAAKEKKKANGD